MEYTGERIRELLMEMAEPEYAKFSGALLGREAVMLGVRLPKIRELAKKIAKAEGREYLDNMLPDESPEKQAETKAQDGCSCKEEQEDFPYMEELMLYGMVIGSMKERLDILFPYIKRYVDRIDN